MAHGAMEPWLMEPWLMEPWPMAQGPRAQGQGIEGARFPPFGFALAEISSSFVKNTYCALILIEGARFPPLGFAKAKISSNSNEDVSLSRKDLLCPDSDRGRSVSPIRVRYSGDKLEFERRQF